MASLIPSMVAGFIATVALSVLMLLKGAMGLMPELNPIAMLTDMASQNMGMPASPVVGWVAHFAIGTVMWGILFKLLHGWLPGGNALLKGVWFAALAWLMMMIGPMPMAGAGLFGMNLGVMAPAMTLIMHLAWGVVLGGTYGRLQAHSSAPGAAAVS